MTNKRTDEEIVEEFRNQYDELGLKPPKNSMPNLERELIVDYWRKALKEARANERDAWLAGNRCSVCGDDNRDSGGLSDVCRKCIEEQ